MRLVGDSLAELGVVEGTLAVVDRLERPKSGHVVIARIDADFTCKVLHLRNAQMRLKAANPNYPDSVPKEGQTMEIIGVVTAFIRKPTSICATFRLSDLGGLRAFCTEGECMQPSDALVALAPYGIVQPEQSGRPHQSAAENDE